MTRKSENETKKLIYIMTAVAASRVMIDAVGFAVFVKANGKFGRACHNTIVKLERRGLVTVPGAGRHVATTEDGRFMLAGAKSALGIRHAGDIGSRDWVVASIDSFGYPPVSGDTADRLMYCRYGHGWQVQSDLCCPECQRYDDARRTADQAPAPIIGRPWWTGALADGTRVEVIPDRESADAPIRYSVYVAGHCEESLLRRGDALQSIDALGAVGQFIGTCAGRRPIVDDDVETARKTVIDELIERVDIDNGVERAASYRREIDAWNTLRRDASRRHDAVMVEACILACLHLRRIVDDLLC